MFHENYVRVKPLYPFNIFHIHIVKVVCKFIDFVYIPEYKVSNFPRKWYEFIFTFLMENVQPKNILPCCFCDKKFIRYMEWKRGILLGTKNPDSIAIFCLLQHPLFIQEFIFLVGYSGGIFTKQ
jgi:hypothetical protein